MIRARIIVTDDIIGLQVYGHAEVAKEHTTPLGENVICSGVSAIAQTAMLECLRRGGKLTDKEKGKLSFVIDRSKENVAIVETAYRGIMQIAKQYPKHFER